jgi:hypothetical protein
MEKHEQVLTSGSCVEFQGTEAYILLGIFRDYRYNTYVKEFPKLKRVQNTFKTSKKQAGKNFVFNIIVLKVLLVLRVTNRR